MSANGGVSAGHTVLLRLQGEAWGAIKPIGQALENIGIAERYDQRSDAYFWAAARGAYELERERPELAMELRQIRDWIRQGLADDEREGKHSLVANRALLVESQCHCRRISSTLERWLEALRAKLRKGAAA